MAKKYSQEDIEIMELENKYGRKAKRRLSKIDKLLNPTSYKLIDLDDDTFDKFLKHLRYDETPVASSDENKSVSSSNSDESVSNSFPNQGE